MVLKLLLVRVSEICIVLLQFCVLRQVKVYVFGCGKRLFFQSSLLLLLQKKVLIKLVFGVQVFILSMVVLLQFVSVCVGKVQVLGVLMRLFFYSNGLFVQQLVLMMIGVGGQFGVRKMVDLQFCVGLNWWLQGCIVVYVVVFLGSGVVVWKKVLSLILVGGRRLFFFGLLFIWKQYLLKQFLVVVQEKLGDKVLVLSNMGLGLYLVVCLWQWQICFLFDIV